VLRNPERTPSAKTLSVIVMRRLINISFLILTFPIFTFGQPKNYKDELGRKQGVHEGYSGSFLFERTYKNDTLTDDAINYYQSGSVKSKGNRHNGTWTEFYENGNVKSKQSFKNGNLSGQSFLFSIKGDTLLPRQINPKLVVNDISITNNTDLKVYLLFDPYDSLNRPIDFGPYLFDYIPVCKNDYLTIHIGTINFLIKPTGLWVYEQMDTICNQKIKVNGFTTNRKVKELKNGDYDISYELEKKYFNSRLGKIEVERKQMQCDDTGKNPVTISRNGRKLVFKDIGNLLFFEFDSDNDGKNELYLLNYFSCEGRLEIYKIDDK